MNNKDIRLAIRRSGLFKWQVASMIPLTDANFSRWLRTEMDDDKKARVYKAIEKAEKEYLEEASL